MISTPPHPGDTSRKILEWCQSPRHFSAAGHLPSPYKVLASVSSSTNNSRGPCYPESTCSIGLCPTLHIKQQNLDFPQKGRNLQRICHAAHASWLLCASNFTNRPKAGNCDSIPQVLTWPNLCSCNKLWWDEGMGCLRL